MYIFGRLEKDIYTVVYVPYTDSNIKELSYKKGSWLLMEPIFNNTGVLDSCVLVGISNNDSSVGKTYLTMITPTRYHYEKKDNIMKPELYLSNIVLFKDDASFDTIDEVTRKVISAYNKQEDIESESTLCTYSED